MTLKGLPCLDELGYKRAGLLASVAWGSNRHELHIQTTEGELLCMDPSTGELKGSIDLIGDEELLDHLIFSQLNYFSEICYFDRSIFSVVVNSIKSISYLAVRRPDGTVTSKELGRGQWRFLTSDDCIRLYEVQEQGELMEIDPITLKIKSHRPVPRLINFLQEGQELIGVQNGETLVLLDLRSDQVQRINLSEIASIRWSYAKRLGVSDFCLAGFNEISKEFVVAKFDSVSRQANFKQIASHSIFNRQALNAALAGGRDLYSIVDMVALRGGQHLMVIGGSRVSPDTDSACSLALLGSNYDLLEVKYPSQVTDEWNSCTGIKSLNEHIHFIQTWDTGCIVEILE